ncbi:MAG: PAS domain-containing sensor histidine kinase, partial [Syntrophales bacterium]
DLFRLLNVSRNLCENVDEALHLTAVFFGAQQIALYRKHYSDSNNCHLIRTGYWKQQCKSRETQFLSASRLKANIFAPDQWHRIEAREAISISNIAVGHKWGPNLVLPLFLGKALFGFIVLIGNESFNGRVQSDVIKAICQVFEAWIARLDAEKRLIDLMDFVRHPIMTVDSEGVITGWSKASEEMTGWRRKDLIGRGNYSQGLAYYGTRRPTIPDLILHPDPKWEATYPEFRREGNTIYSLSFCPAVIGGAAYLKTKTSLIRDLNNRIAGDIHMVEDMSRELEMKENLNRSESMYRAITDFAGVGIMVLTGDSIIYHNEHFAELLKNTDDTIGLDALRSWISRGDRERVFGYFEKLLSEPEGVARFEFSAGQGEKTKYYKAYTKVMQSDGEVALHFIVDDITKQRELAQKARLNEMRIHHEDRLTALGIMAAGIAHELNQPLNHIRMTADSLLMSEEKNWKLTSEDIDKGLQVISRQVVRMSQIIQNIRNFSSKDRGQITDDIDIQINNAVENVLCMIGRQIEAHGIHLHKTLNLSLPSIRMNQNRLEQVILNLVVNARQALEQCNKREKNLFVRTGTILDRVFIEVADNAFGIQEDLKQKIFEPFFTTKEADEGTGLGLSIVQSIMEECGGSVEVMNNEIGGATFTVFGPAGE